MYLNRRLLPENMKPRVRDTAHLSSVPSEKCGEFFLPISLLNIGYFVNISIIDTNYLFKMFANLKCLREGSFQITINNLRLHLPLCNKGVIYGCIETSFMTLYDFKERPLMNVPPLNAAHQVFLMISLMHHNIIHFLITMYVGFNIVWQSEFAFHDS